MPQKSCIPRPYINMDLHQIGIKDIEYFNKSFDNLCKRWWDRIGFHLDLILLLEC